MEKDYKVIKKLGEGGSGDVYLIEKKCALKKFNKILIETREREKKDEEKEENEFVKDKALGIYKEKKEITIDESLKILFYKNPVNLSFLKEEDANLFKDKKISLKNNLKTFQKYYDSFIQIAPAIDEEEFKITEEIKNNESELIEKLKYYGNLISKILKNEIEINQALDEINSLKSMVNKEIKEEKLLINNILKMDYDTNNICQKIDSKINRIQLIIRFVKEQSDKFYLYQKELYNKYEDSCNEIIKKYEFIDNIIKYNSQLEEEDLIEKWIKTGPLFEEKYLKSDIIINNLKELISSVKLDIKYFNDEKFVLWAFKENYSRYLYN